MSNFIRVHIYFFMYIAMFVMAGPRQQDALADLDRLVHEQDPVHLAQEAWLFLSRDIQAVATAPAILDAMINAKKSGASGNALAVILHFNEMLDRAGIELMVVPIPPKAAVYVDKITPQISPPQAYAAFERFNQFLASQGIAVIDLFPLLLNMRKEGIDSFCRTDTHWSPQAVRSVAEDLSDRVAPGSAEAREHRKLGQSQVRSLSVKGDLATMIPDRNISSETLFLQTITRDKQPFEPDRNADLLLLGDSHTLVFSQGLLGKHAGLADHLWAHLGIPVDLVGVQGGGANGSRIKLARRRDNLYGKKKVIWCFAARELVQPTQPWKPIPVIR